MIGRIVDGHEVVRSLGKGGMGEVYLALSPTGAPRAYKIVRADRLSGPQATARFRREINLLDRLEHPGIVQILATGQLSGGGMYLAMEYVDGPDLQQAVDKHGPLSVIDTLKLMIQLAEALASAHHQKVVHRDLKPANVLLPGGDPARAKIIDFGLAKLAADEGMSRLTDDEQVLGSPQYLAPEQTSSSTVGPEADIYALGGLAYFALTGKPLFAARSAVATVYAHVHEMPEPLATRAPELELPNGLGELIAACVAKAPAARPTALQLVTRLPPMLVNAPASMALRPKRLFETNESLQNGNELEEAVTAQVRQIVLELAAILDLPTDAPDQVENELSELELELAMLDSEVEVSIDAAHDDRHRQVTAHVAELRRGHERALQELTDAVLSKRDTAPAEAGPLYEELAALFARYRSR